MDASTISIFKHQQTLSVCKMTTINTHVLLINEVDDVGENIFLSLFTCATH